MALIYKRLNKRLKTKDFKRRNHEKKKKAKLTKIKRMKITDNLKKKKEKKKKSATVGTEENINCLML